MAKSALKSLKKVQETKEETAQPAAEKTVETVEKKKGSGLIPRQKSPEKQKEEQELKDAITTALKGKKDGLMASELREAIFEGVAEDEQKDVERKIRAMCRILNCKVVPVDGSRKVRYILP